MSFADIWRILDDLLDQSRSHHARRYAAIDSRHPACLLCCPRSLAFRQPHSAKAGRMPSAAPSSSSSAAGGGAFPSTSLLSSSAAAAAAAISSSVTSSTSSSASGLSLVAPPTVAGFVDLSFPHYHPRLSHHHHQQMVIAGSSVTHRSGGAASAYSTSGSDTPPTAAPTPQPPSASTLFMNGHANTVDPSPPGSTAGGSGYGGAGSRYGGAGGFRFPHVVGYYEIDSRKPFPKDSKLKSNVGIDQLKAAIVRLSSHSGSIVDGCSSCCGGAVGVPASWMAFIRHVSSIREQAPNVPFIGYDEVCLCYQRRHWFKSCWHGDSSGCRGRVILIVELIAHPRCALRNISCRRHNDD